MKIARSTDQQNEVSGIMVNHVEDIQQCAEEASNASAEIGSVSDELNELAFKTRGNCASV